MPTGHPKNPAPESLPDEYWWVSRPLLTKRQWEGTHGRSINLAIRNQCAYVDQASNLYDRHYRPLCLDLTVDVCHPNCEDMLYGFGVDLDRHPITSLEMLEWFKWTEDTWKELAKLVGEELAGKVRSRIHASPSVEMGP